MAAENRQLKSNFLGKMAPASSTHDGQKQSGTMLHSKTHDEVDHVAATKEITFKSSYSETNITSKKVSSTVNGNTEKYSSESYTIHNSNGVKHVEITKENGEKLPSPMKSFIQQRVERLYGPGALAQGFFNQKRHKKGNDGACSSKVLTEKSINCLTGERNHSYLRPTAEAEDHENVECTSPNGSPSLPVLRHLRPEFRAQLPILSPKKSPGRTDIAPPSVNGAVPRLSLDSPKKNLANKSEVCEVNPVIKSVTEGIDSVVLSERANVMDVAKITDRKVNSAETKVNKVEVKVNGAEEKVNGVEIKLNGVEKVNGAAVKTNGSALEVRDAHYFLDLEKKETERLMKMAASVEAELETLQNAEVSEEVLGLMRSAAGKARLLATQKMQQFEGLCYNNINGRADEQFPTTLGDLQGFWDMVCLQLRHLEELFAEVDRLRERGWKESEPTPVTSPTTPSPRAPRPRTSPASAPPPTERARRAAEKREADRRAMLEQRRRVVREKQLAAASCSPGTSREDQHEMAIEGSQEVEIFIGGAVKAKCAPQGDHVSGSQSRDSLHSVHSS